MKKLFFLFLALSLFINVFSQTNSTGIAIIPEPVSLTKNAGHFILPKNITIGYPKKAEFDQTILSLSSKLHTATGSVVSVTSKPAATNTIRLLLNKTSDAAIGKEGYVLNVTPAGITIKANEPAGLFYGVQTLWQLFPKEIESKNLLPNIKWEAPCVDITDYPRFGWRGLMFDVARHFFTKEDVKNILMQMVRYKYQFAASCI